MKQHDDFDLDAIIENGNPSGEQFIIKSHFIEKEKDYDYELVKEIDDAFNDISNLTFDSNEEDVEKLTIGNQKFSNNLSDKLKFIDGRKSRFFLDSFYNDLEEFHGIIENIDNTRNKFKATLTDINNSNKIINVEFDMDEIQYESDKTLIQIGTKIVWIIGYETKILICNGEMKNGPRTNISKCIIRRTKAITQWGKENANEKANEWTRFFNECSTED